MALRWNLQNGKLVIEPSSLTIDAFNAIWKFDKNRNKLKAESLLKYVFFMNDITQNNPLVDLPEHEKDGKARRTCFMDENYKFTRREQELIDDATNWFITCTDNAALRAYFVLNKQIDDLTTYLQGLPYDAKNIDVKHKATKQLREMMEDRMKVEKMVRLELDKQKTRGGLERSPREKGMLLLRKQKEAEAEDEDYVPEYKPEEEEEEDEE